MAWNGDLIVTWRWNLSVIACHDVWLALPGPEVEYSLLRQPWVKVAVFHILFSVASWAPPIGQCAVLDSRVWTILGLIQPGWSCSLMCPGYSITATLFFIVIDRTTVEGLPPVVFASWVIRTVYLLHLVSWRPEWKWFIWFRFLRIIEQRRIPILCIQKRNKSILMDEGFISPKINEGLKKLELHFKSKSWNTLASSIY